MRIIGKENLLVWGLSRLVEAKLIIEGINFLHFIFPIGHPNYCTLKIFYIIIKINPHLQHQFSLWGFSKDFFVQKQLCHFYFGPDRIQSGIREIISGIIKIICWNDMLFFPFIILRGSVVVFRTLPMVSTSFLLHSNV